MRAFLAVSDVSLLIGPNQDAGIRLSRVPKQTDFAHANVVGVADVLFLESGSMAKQGTHKDPRIADKHAQAGENQEFGELSPANVAFVGGMDREFILPYRFSAGLPKQSHGFASHI
jgi:hypothetical protein